MAYDDDLVPLDYTPEPVDAPVPAKPAPAPAPAPAAAAPDDDLVPLDYTPEPVDAAPKENMLGEDVAPLPEQQPKPESDLIPLDFDPRFERDKPNWVSNVVRGAGQRAGQLVGGVAGAIGDLSEVGGDWFDQNLGKPVQEADGSITWRRLTDDEVKGRSSWITQKLDEVREGLKNPDLGYRARTTWEDVKNAPMSNVIPFAMEQGLISVPDMVVAVASPGLYTFEQMGEIARTRAGNEGRTEPTAGDLFKALPAAAISTLMEKIGTEKMLGIGAVALDEIKQLPVEVVKTMLTEGATEAAQQMAQIGGESAFTQKGIDWWDAASQTLQAAVVGTIFGGAVRTGTGGLELATKPKDTAVDAPAQDAGGVPPEESETSGEPDPGGLGGTPAPPVNAPASVTTDEEKLVQQPSVETPAAAIVPKKEPAPAAAKSTTPEVVTTIASDIGAALGQPAPQPEDQEFDEDVAPTTSYEDTDVSQPGTPAPTAPVQPTVQAAPAPPAKRGRPAKAQKAIEAAAARAKVVEAGTDEQAALGATTEQPTTPQAAPIAAPEIGAPAAPAPAPVPEPAAEVQPEPAPVEQPAAPVIQPEIAGTPEAAYRQPLPSRYGNIEEEPEAAAPPTVAALPSRYGNIEEEPVAEEEQAPLAPPAVEGVAAYQTAPAAPVTAAPRPVVVETKKSFRKAIEARKAAKAPTAQPQAETAPAPAPAAEKAKDVAIVRQLGDAAAEHPSLNLDAISDDPRFGRILREVAQAVADAEGRQPGTAPVDYVRGKVDAVVDEVKRRFAQEEETEAQRGETALEHARKVAEARTVRRSDVRTGKKAPSQAMEKWGKETLRQRSKAELEKAERGEPHDEDLADYRRAQVKRGKIKTGGSTESDQAIMAESHARAMESSRQKWLAKQREKEAAEKKPAEPAEPEPTDLQKTHVEQTEASKRAAAIARVKKANRRKAELEPKIREAVEKIPDLSMRDVRDTNQVGAYIKNVVGTITKAITDAGYTIGRDINPLWQTPYESLAIYGKQLLAPTNTHPGQNAVDFLLAKTYADAGDNSNFNGMVQDDRVKAYEKGGVENLENIADTTVGPEAVARAKAPKPRAMLDEPAVTEQADNGQDISFTPDRTTKASTLLRQVTGQQAWSRGGMLRVLQKMHMKMLHKMVGDMDVHFVDTSTMQALSGQKTAAGLYAPARVTDADSYKKGRIYINTDTWAERSPEQQQHIVVHEMTHAATEFALTHDFRGTGAIATAMTNALKAQLKASGDWEKLGFHTRYGLNDEHEFIAEAFSNPMFQRLLASHTVPQHIVKMLQGRSDRAPTWFEAFSAFVSNALGMANLRGTKAGMDYMQAVIALHPDLMMSEQEQEQRAAEDFAGDIALHGDYYGRPEGISSPHALNIPGVYNDARTRVEAFKESLKNGTATTDTGRWLRSLFTTLEEMNRSSRDLFGGNYDNPFTRFTHLVLSKNPLRNKIAEAGDMLSVELAKFGQKNHDMAEKISDFVYGSTQNETDPRYGLGHKNNKHVNKKGFRHAKKRGAHRRLEAEWAALSPEAKQLVNKLVDHYQTYQQQKVELTVKNTIDSAFDAHGYVLPKGVSKQDVYDWVMSGEIDKPVANQTQYDKDLHAALKGTGKALKDSKDLRSIKGIYVPLTRWGKYFFTARENLQTPAGATVDPNNPNIFIFKDLKNLQAYQDTTDHTHLSTVSRWRDPVKGTITTKEDQYAHPVTGQLVIPQQEVHVTVQDKIMEMSDNRGELMARLKGYQKAGLTPTEIAETETSMNVNNPILPGHVTRLLRNIDQNGKSATSREIGRNAVIESYYKTMSGSRAHKNRLKRNNVGGFSRDLVRSTASNNRVLAGHITNLMIQPEIDAAEKELDKYIDDNRRNNYSADGRDTLRRQEFAKEAKARLAKLQAGQDSSRAGNALLAVSFINHLASFAYSFVNALQPLVTTVPLLLSKHGAGAFRAGTRNLAELGALSTYFTGIKETGSELKHMAKSAVTRGETFTRADEAEDYHQRAVAALGKSKTNAKTKVKAAERLRELGFGVDDNVEIADTQEFDMNKAEKAINRAGRAARALPQAVEMVNRYWTLATSVDLALRDGMTEEQAIDYAVSTVEETQGGYAAENNPRVFGGAGKFIFQFKKYAVMFAQLYYGAFAGMFKGSSRRTKAQAAKQLVGLSLVMMAFAGFGGLPFMELAKMTILAANVLGIEDDDWESYENSMQGFMAGMLSTIFGDKGGKKAAEVFMHGLPRLLNTDLSGRMGGDSLFSFGAPKSTADSDWRTWLLNNVAGAPGTMVLDSMKAIGEGNWEKVVPLPKIVTDTLTGYSDFMEGKKTAAGKQYVDPSTGVEFFQKILGFQSGTAAGRYEYGGEGAAYKAKTKAVQDRQKVMGKWLNADSNERGRIWDEVIAPWNEGKSKDQRIDKGDLHRTLQRRKTDAKKQAKEKANQ